MHRAQASDRPLSISTRPCEGLLQTADLNAVSMVTAPRLPLPSGLSLEPWTCASGACLTSTRPSSSHTPTSSASKACQCYLPHCPLVGRVVAGPPVGQAVSQGVSRGGYGLRKWLGSLFLMSGTVPPPWLFALRCLNTGAYRLLGGARCWCQDPKQDVYRQSEFTSL